MYDDFGTIYLDIKPNTGIKRVLLITSTGSDSKVITVVQAGDTPGARAGTRTRAGREVQHPRQLEDGAPLYGRDRQ